MAQVRVFTGPDKWLLQDTDGSAFWIDLWAVEAIAEVIRQVDNLGANYRVTLEELPEQPRTP